MSQLFRPFRQRRDRRQDQVAEPGPEAVADRRVADGGQPAEIGGEEDDEQDAEPEIGHREPEKGDEGDAVVDRPAAPQCRDQPSRDGDGDGDEEGQDGQRQRARRRLDQDLADGRRV